MTPMNEQLKEWLQKASREEITKEFAIALLGKGGDQAESMMLSLLFSASLDRPSLENLKELAVKSKSYETAVWLRDLQEKQFPETDEIKEIRRKVITIQSILAMCEVNAPKDVVYTFIQAFGRFNALGGDFSIKDAAEIIAKTKELYG